MFAHHLWITLAEDRPQPHLVYESLRNIWNTQLRPSAYLSHLMKWEACWIFSPWCCRHYDLCEADIDWKLADYRLLLFLVLIPPSKRSQAPSSWITDWMTHACRPPLFMMRPSDHADLTDPSGFSDATAGLHGMWKASKIQLTYYLERKKRQPLLRIDFWIPCDVHPSSEWLIVFISF